MTPFNDKIIISSYFDVTVFDGVLSTLPIGHSRQYPLSFKLEDKKIISGELNFFNTNLYNNFSSTNFLPDNKYDLKINSSKDSIVIINLLDNCFGHSLLKLFSSAKYINKHKDEYDFLLIVPKALEHFLVEKPGVSVLSVSLKFAELEKCYILNNVINTVTRNYKSSFVSSPETYDTFNFDELKKDLNFFNTQTHTPPQNKILFYYRSDFWRKWGGNKQYKNCINLFSLLKPFFDNSVEFCVVGDKDSMKFPSWISDYRVNSFSSQVDFQYNNLFQSSLLCIGLTGSHMLFPSVLSKCTVHLHPIYKYKNMAEDVVVCQDSNEMLSAYRHLYYFGNYNCSDITASKLCNLILTHLIGLLEKEHKINDYSQSQNEWIKTSYSWIKNAEIVAYRKAYIHAENKKIAQKYYISKLINLVLRKN